MVFLKTIEKSLSWCVFNKTLPQVFEAFMRVISGSLGKEKMYSFMHPHAAPVRPSPQSSHNWPQDFQMFLPSPWSTMFTSKYSLLIIVSYILLAFLPIYLISVLFFLLSGETNSFRAKMPSGFRTSINLIWVWSVTKLRIFMAVHGRGRKENLFQ